MNLTDDSTDVSNARLDVLTRLSHELRTPLNSVIGFSRLLQRNRVGNQRPNDLEMLRAIRVNGERLLGLVEDLMAISCASPSFLNTASPWACIADIADACVRQWKPAALATGLDIVLEVQSSGQLRVDATTLSRVLCKLVGNAVKFTESGLVTVTVTCSARGDTPGSVVVADTGIGIRSNRMATIFDPFTQVDSSTSRSYEGAGLGLSVARALAESLHYHLSVQSTEGVGTRFTLELDA